MRIDRQLDGIDNNKYTDDEKNDKESDKDNRDTVLEAFKRCGKIKTVINLSYPFDLTEIIVKSCNLGIILIFDSEAIVKRIIAALLHIIENVLKARIISLHRFKSVIL